jgi:hypothetical protein
MNRKLPIDAFEFYFGLGVKRSYAAVAAKYGVSKKTVVAHALKDEWQKRIVDRERKVRDTSEKNAVDALVAMNEKHLRMLEFVQGKALQALKQFAFEDAPQAVRALTAAIDHERIARGEPTERTAIEIEEKIRREHDLFLLKPGQREEWSDGDRSTG